MSDLIAQKTAELVAAFAESPEMQRMQAQEEAVRRDPEAARLFRAYLEAQRAFAAAGGDAGPAEVEGLTRALHAARGNPAIARLMDLQQALLDRLTASQDALMRAIGLEPPKRARQKRRAAGSPPATPL
jgi:cell fate (sporulation/competence/biofilm development) regulator YlbF (YheA/YmcA/DUF963 family)